MSNKSVEITAHVAYYRVSTKRQGDTGLGLDAQRHAVEQYLKREPEYAFTEVESGRNSKRPQLARAIACCRANKARLIIAKLDRLARNASFVLKLRDEGVEFLALDLPNANKLTITIMAAMAEQEADWISERTKAGLAAAKRQGVKLGNPRPAKSLKKAWAARKQQSKAFAQGLQVVLAKAEKHGATTLQEKAEALNRLGYTTPNGKQFHPQSVKNLLQQLQS